MGSAPTYCIVPCATGEFESWVVDLSQSHSISYFASSLLSFLKKDKNIKKYITNLVCTEEMYALIWAIYDL